MQKIRGWLVKLDSLRFDLWHKVETRAVRIDFKQRHDDPAHGFWYLPTRPSVIARVLRELPIERYNETHFIDLGSGKGRVLLLAAKYPFKHLTGIEFRTSLHQIARRNLQTQKHFRIRSQAIELLNIDAFDFEFPDEDMVIYLFNPFGVEIMRKILMKLQAVLHRTGRTALLVMVNSEFDELMQSFTQFELLHRSRLRSIYRNKIMQ